MLFEHPVTQSFGVRREHFWTPPHCLTDVCWGVMYSIYLPTSPKCTDLCIEQYVEVLTWPWKMCLCGDTGSVCLYLGCKMYFHIFPWSARLIRVSPWLRLIVQIFWCLRVHEIMFLLGPGNANGSTNDCNHSTQWDIFPAVKLSFILWTHQTHFSVWAWLVVLANSIRKLSHLLEESIICCICRSDSLFLSFGFDRLWKEIRNGYKNGTLSETKHDKTGPYYHKLDPVRMFWPSLHDPLAHLLVCTHILSSYY